MSRKKKRRKPNNWVHPRKAMWLKQRYRCGICKKTIRWKHLFTDKVNIDHIRPRSHGGGSSPSNLQLAHRPCNEKKRKVHPVRDALPATNRRTPMDRQLGHNIYTVEDLINGLKKFDPTYQVGLNLKQYLGYSIKKFREDHTNGIVDIELQVSYNPLSGGMLEYDDEGNFIGAVGDYYRG